MALPVLTTTLAPYLAAGIGDVSPTAPPGSDKFLQVLSWLMWACTIGCVAGMVIAGAMLAYQRVQGGGGDAQGKLVGAMIGAAVIGVASMVVNTLI